MSLKEIKKERGTYTTISNRKERAGAGAFAAEKRWNRTENENNEKMTREREREQKKATKRKYVRPEVNRAQVWLHVKLWIKPLNIHLFSRIISMHHIESFDITIYALHRISHLFLSPALPLALSLSVVLFYNKIRIVRLSIDSNEENIIK